MKTGIIRYNLKERMRQFNGVERKFNVPELVKIINSPKVQERVRLGDLNGYYGHWPRIQFGAEPQEGGVLNGKPVYLEPCCRTIYLKAYDDGTVEHEQEFFNNEPGTKAFKLTQDKSGGFSSVITTSNGYGFHGFDYVAEPNFAANRPYALLDSVNTELALCDEVMILDEAVDLTEEHNKNKLMTFLSDSLEIYIDECERLKQDNRLLTDTVERLSMQNDLLLDDIVILKEKSESKTQENQLHFDSMQLDSVIAKAESFKTAPVELTAEQLEEMECGDNQQINDLMVRYGY